MIALHRIKWSGYSSIDLDLIIDCCFDPDSGETSSFLNREAVATDSYRGDYRRIHNFKYNEFFTPKFTFIKRGFGDFSADDYRRLMSWLTSKSTTGVLTAYRDDSEVVEFECIGNWGEIQPYKMANHRTVGVTAVFETTSPWAYSPIKTVTATITQPTILNIECNTDDWDTPVYPKITIEQSNDIVVNVTEDIFHNLRYNNNYIDGTIYRCGDKCYWETINENGNLSQYENDYKNRPLNWFTTSVSLYNETTELETYIKGNTANEKIIIDGANKLITTESKSRSVIGNDFAFKWLPLVRGENKIHIIGNCTITFEWREPIKLGEY